MPNRRLLVVDDSITIRAMIEQIFQHVTDMRVVGVAGSAAEAADAIDRLRPDVLTLDLSMPGMDGLTFLTRLMRERPVAVVIVSSASTKASDVCARALELGAAACFDKAHIVSDARAFVKAVRNARPGRVRDAAAGR